MTKFFFALTLMMIAIFSLIYVAFNIGEGYPVAHLLFVQSLQGLGCYGLLGIGFGVPIVLLATVFGWIQLLLLVSGNISPHLAKEGFFKVIKTLFSKM